MVTKFWWTPNIFNLLLNRHRPRWRDCPARNFFLQEYCSFEQYQQPQKLKEIAFLFLDPEPHGVQESIKIRLDKLQKMPAFQDVDHL